MFEVINIGTTKTVATEQACNHVFVVDVSGSMWNDLPQIRTALKNIISMTGKEEDTASLIWFSGRGQCGVVFENVLLSDINTINTIHQSIDRFIKPIGATGFVDPIRLAMSISIDDKKVSSLIMMTDGYDNCSVRSQIIEESEKLKNRYSSIAFIEYGYYADRNMIASMAQAANGIHMFADGVSNYEKLLEERTSNIAHVQNIEVKVNKAAKDCIFIEGKRVRIVPVKEGKALVPESIDKVHSIVPKDVLSKQLSEDHLYMILFYAAKTENDKLVWDVLQVLGDVKLIRMYSNCFTKQEMSAFEKECETCAIEPDTRFFEGKDPFAVPDKNAPTVMELLFGLSAEDADTQLLTKSVYWDYKRIGRARTSESEYPRFIESALGGVALKNLVFSTERPNVSIQTVVSGMVELPENEHGLGSVPSFITRNYTIIKDGIVNVTKLPVLMNANAFEQLSSKFSNTVIERTNDKVHTVFDLAGVPVVNRGMVESVSSEKFCEAVATLQKTKAALKVVKHKLDSLGTNTKTAGMVQQYGEEAAKWLSSIGVRDYGFSKVGTTQEDASDEYEAIELSVKIAGLSSLPAINAVEKKIESGKKLNVADSLIKTFLDMYVSESDVGKLATIRAGWEIIKKEVEEELSNYTNALILGRKWFCEDAVFSSEINIAGIKTTMSAEKRRVTIKI